MDFHHIVRTVLMKSFSSQACTSQPTTIWQVHAIRYATLQSRRSQVFLDEAPNDDGRQDLDYYIWALVAPNRCIVVDTGCRKEIAERRGRTYLRDPRDGLAQLGIDAAQVEHVVITHLHYDHAGNLAQYPNARFYLQEREMKFATGRLMCGGSLFTGAIEQDDIVSMVRTVFAQRVQFIDGAEEIASGVQLERIGGHTPGIQVVRVLTERGWVVLASDGSHLYENMSSNRPFHIVADIDEMRSGWKTAIELAQSHDHVIPGHDPLVLKQYPASLPSLNGIVALHKSPLFSALGQKSQLS